jgi:hypothetical protein
VDSLSFRHAVFTTEPIQIKLFGANIFTADFQSEGSKQIYRDKGYGKVYTCTTMSRRGISIWSVLCIVCICYITLELYSILAKYIQFGLCEGDAILFVLTVRHTVLTRELI